MLEKTFAPGMTVSLVARRHGVALERATGQKTAAAAAVAAERRFPMTTLTRARRRRPKGRTWRLR